MAQKFTNTFNEGIDQDTSKNKRSNASYFDALDLRIISDDALSNGALVNFNGTKAKLDLIDRDHQLCGYAEVRDTLALFMVDSSTEARSFVNLFIPSASNNDELYIYSNFGIFRFIISTTYDYTDTAPAGYTGYLGITAGTGTELAAELSQYTEVTDNYDISSPSADALIIRANADGSEYNFNTDGVSDSIDFNSVRNDYYSGESKILKVIPDNTLNLQQLTLVYSDIDSVTKLNFNPDKTIDAIGRYETNDIQKVYWADGDNPYRYVNIQENYAPSGTFAESTILSSIPNVDFGTIRDTDVIAGGNYQAGVVCHAYQLFTKNGSETTISDISNVSKLSLTGYNKTGGSELDENVNKSVEVSIDGIDQNFNRLRLISIYYKELNAIPEIRIVNEYSVASDSMVLIDSGNFIGTYTLEEFRVLNQVTYVPELLESKDNILFLGNIKEDTFDSDVIDGWDARAYRYNANVFDVTALTASITSWNLTTGFMDVTVDASDIFLQSFVGSYLEGIVPGVGLQEKSLVKVLSVYNSGFSATLQAMPTASQTGSTLSILGFTDYSNAKIKGTDGSSIYITPSGKWASEDIGGLTTDQGSSFNIPEEFDCINEYNNVFTLDYQDRQSNYAYTNDSNGVLGGEGTNIQYEFVTGSSDTIIADLSPNAKAEEHLRVKSNLFSFPGDGDFEAIETQSGDVYRTGILFINKYGQNSFVKWIGDIMTPEDYSNSTNGVNENLINKKFLKVTVKSFPSDPDIVGWKTVRVKREFNDRSIACSGITGPTYKDNTKDFYRLYADANSISAPCSGIIPITDHHNSTNPFDGSATTNISDNIWELYSPEIQFDKSFIDRLGDIKIRISGQYDNRTSVSSIDSSNFHYFNFTKFGNLSSYSKTVKDYNIDSINKVSTRYAQASTESSYGASDSPIIVYNNETFLNQIRVVNQNGDDYASGPSGAVIYISSGIDKEGELNVYTCYHFNLLKNVDLSRYGGLSYQSRLNNTYIDFSDMHPISESSAICTKGDIVTAPYSMIRGYFFDTKESNREGVQDVMSFPVESSIDLRYRLDDFWQYLTTAETFVRDKSYGILETVEDGIRLWGEQYPSEIGDLYRYNTVYSQQLDVNSYFPKPSDFSNESNIDTKILASNEKINGESSDSWTSISANNFIEVDSRYGELTKLIRLNNKLLFFQNNGFGVLAINDRSLISGEGSGVKLALGTGGVLERYDYVSDSVGAIDKNHVVSSNNDVYFVDVNRKGVYSVNNADTPISIKNGFNSLIRRILSEDSKIVVGFDPKFNEVLFTIDNDTLCFNENTSALTSRYSTVPDRYVNLNKNLFSYVNDETTGGTDRHLFKHNIGERGEYYTEAYGLPKSTSKVSILINPNGNYINAFHSLDLRNDIIDGATSDDLNETVSRIKYENSYIPEDSIDIRLTDVSPSLLKNASHIARAIRTQVPITSDGNRFVDTYILVTLEYDNTNDNLFRIHDVMTVYDVAR